MYLKTIDNFSYLILEIIISIFIVLRNNMLNELIIYLLVSCYCYGKICHMIILLPKIHLPRKNLKTATNYRHFIMYFY